MREEKENKIQPPPDMIIERKVLNAINAKDTLTMRELIRRLPFYYIPYSQRNKLSRLLNIKLKEFTNV